MAVHLRVQDPGSSEAALKKPNSRHSRFRIRGAVENPREKNHSNVPDKITKANNLGRYEETWQKRKKYN